MRLLINFLPVILILLMPGLVLADQIKLYLDNTRTKHIMVEQQDCSVHKTEDGRITLGFKLGGLLWGVGPEISFGKKEGIDWDHTVQGLIARYQELCARFNTGSITKQEYDERMAKIEGIEEDAYKLYQEFIRKKAQRKNDMFDELDKDLGRFRSLKQSYDKINRQLKLE